MFVIKLKFVLFFIIFHVSYCERRLRDGEIVSVPKKYVVYLIKAPISELIYDYWLCGGAIVSEEFVITSAACVNDVDYLYVIAGYNKYVPDVKIEEDPCTKEMKKKIIYVCSPKGYSLKYKEVDYWSYIDIALARVDTPFDFTDTAYEQYCSYIPTTIAINYDYKYQEPGTDALVLGWGHRMFWRKTSDNKNYNQEYLRYAPVLLYNKTDCVDHFTEFTNMSEVINDYMICSLGKGNVNDAGQTILKSDPITGGCTTYQQKILGFEGISCEEETYEHSSSSEYRRKNDEKFIKTNNGSLIDMNKTDANRRLYDKEDFSEPTESAEDPGICQNDHGGPIITWAGAREILIGVASVFKVIRAESKTRMANSDKKKTAFHCMGPYLYTSTLCTGLFLDCILTATDFNRRVNGTTRRDLCNRPAREKGYETIERHITWNDQPVGEASKSLKSDKNKKNLANKKNSPNGGLRTGPNPTNERYIPPNMKNWPNQRYFESMKKAPNGRYAPNIKHVPNERYSADIKIKPNDKLLANNAPHERYQVNTNYAPNERYIVKEMYPEINKYKANVMYGSQTVPEQKEMPMEKVYPAPLPMRAQIPLRN